MTSPQILRMEGLRSALVDVLSRGTWREIENAYRRADLPWRKDLEPGWGKDRYNERVLGQIADADIVTLAKRVVERFESDASIRSLEDALWWIEDQCQQRISEITRGNITDAFDGKMISGFEGLDTFVKKLAGLGAVDPAFSFQFAYDESGRLCKVAPHYGAESASVLSTHREALGKAGFFAWPDRRVLHFLETLVDPRVRTEEDQREWLTMLNSHLTADGYVLEEADRISGHPVYRASVRSRTSHRRRPKNLIFASQQDHFKPILGLSDALSNDIVALQNEDTCLIYDEPIPDEGLTWEKLVQWWKATQESEDEGAARRELGSRLLKAIGSRATALLIVFSDDEGPPAERAARATSAGVRAL